MRIKLSHIFFSVDPSEEVSGGDKDNLRKEKKEREHLLALNQVLARQVMEKSRMVAGEEAVPCLVNG